MYQQNTINFDGDDLVPSKIVCVGRNYLAHIEELGNSVPSEPVIFVKPNSAIGAELFSELQETLHYEAELCFLIQGGSIAGVGVGLDLTKRDLQTTLREQGLPWERAKAFDHSAVFSNFVRLSNAIENLSIRLSINGQLVQHGTIDLMINKPQALLSNIAEFMTLADNDILMTGTPKGVGTVQSGQVFTCEVFDGGTSIVSKTWTAQ